MAHVKEAGVVVGVVASVAGAFLISSSLRGLIDERDHLRSQVGALSQHSPPASAPPVSSPTPRPGASPPPDVQAPILRFAGRPGTALIDRPVVRGSVPPAAKPKSKPKPPHSAPSPAPATPHTSACSRAQLLTVRLPLGVLPCSTITVARIAKIGGTR